VPDTPRWRFVAGAVKGKSSEELGAKSMAPEIMHAERIAKREVGELSAPDIKYSEFEKEEREVGKLWFDGPEPEPEPEHEESYGGGVTISRDPNDPSGKVKPLRMWASFQPRNEDQKDSKEYGEDRYTTTIEGESSLQLAQAQDQQLRAYGKRTGGAGTRRLGRILGGQRCVREPEGLLLAPNI